MLRNQSVATIDAPEFIDITPCNDMISKCQIKVFYLGKNRNGSYIDREAALKMANSLPGTPIVAAYRSEKEDFGDHGQVITIEDGEIKTSCKTVPYGFVAPDAEVWFQKYLDTDTFGNEAEREYLVTTGYLWTGQYPEIQKAVDEGLPQSMELSPDTDGHWAYDSESGYDFFIITDSQITKLCVLGSDVEPCFEGASVTGKTQYSQSTPSFAFELLKMRKQLDDLYSNEGELSMPKEGNAPIVEPEEVKTQETFTEASTEASDAVEENFEKKDEEEKEEDKSTDESSDDKEKEDEDDEEESDKKYAAQAEDAAQKSTSAEYAELETRYAAALQELDSLKTEFAAVKSELESLRSFKNDIEEQRKDAEIAKFSMLSEEEKADVIAHKSEYSIDEIKAKLAIVYFEKNMSLHSLEEDQAEESEEETSPITTFSLDSAVDTHFVPAVVQALREAKQS